MKLLKPSPEVLERIAKLEEDHFAAAGKRLSATTSKSQTVPFERRKALIGLVTKSKSHSKRGIRVGRLAPVKLGTHSVNRTYVGE